MTSSLKDLAYGFIRGQLLEGRIRSGTRLSSRALAREIGVSFIPVREAITQLAAEGLVDHEPGVGTFAARVGRQDIEELYDLREALEVHAIASAARRIDDAGIQEVEGWNAKLCALAAARKQGQTSLDDEDLKQWTHADAEFHQALLRAAGNTRMVRAVQDLRVLTQVFRSQRLLRPPEDLETACEQHAALIGCLRTRDAELAKKLMSDHIRFSCRNALLSYQEQREQSP
jgi:DNA-binding GntR family transcriptional regulator